MVIEATEDGVKPTKRRDKGMERSKNLKYA